MVFITKSVILLVALTFVQISFFANGQSTGLSTIIGDKQYFIGNVQKVNWYRANAICASIGMSLASIESDTEATNLKNYLYSNALLSNSFWLSANDLALRSEFIWFSTGNKLNYTKWATRQPGVNALRRCVATNANFEWIRAACAASSSYFICSKPVVPVCGTNNRCLHTTSFYSN